MDDNGYIVKEELKDGINIVLEIPTDTEDNIDIKRDIKNILEHILDEQIRGKE